MRAQPYLTSHKCTDLIDKEVVPSCAPPPPRAGALLHPRGEAALRWRRMSDADNAQRGVRDRLSARGEEALGELAQTLLENPVFNQALQAAFGARDAAQQVAHQAFKNAGVASTSDLDRLGRRIRSLSERVEELEDRVDRLSREVAGLRGDRSRGLDR